jgi:hypothetical protein
MRPLAGQSASMTVKYFADAFFHQVNNTKLDYFEGVTLHLKLMIIFSVTPVTPHSF